MSHTMVWPSTIFLGCIRAPIFSCGLIIFCGTWRKSQNSYFEFIVEMAWAPDCNEKIFKNFSPDLCIYSTYMEEVKCCCTSCGRVWTVESDEQVPLKSNNFLQRFSLNVIWRKGQIYNKELMHFEYIYTYTT